ncbi:MAG: tetratricopeptide repeat protein [Candidatus Competibacter sp.]|nr:tetratricopeptide repeat protein [Candidatus Competibacter sp.]MDG4582993.1 tetratricopeptide repeat protein [Candidatus Competibacter sp.]
MALRRDRRASLLAVGLLAGLAACAGPAPTPLRSQYQSSEERALRYHARGELPQALQGFRDSLRWAEIADDRPAIMAQALNVGTVALALGEWSLAEQHLRKVPRVATALSDPASLLQARLGLAEIHLRRGQFAAARTEFQQTLDEGREQRDNGAVLAALNGLGLTYKGLGQMHEARRSLGEAELLARSGGEKRLLATTLANQASLALRAGEIRQAEIYLAEAVDLDRETESLPGLAHDLALLARVRQEQGDPHEALALYRQARTIARHTGQHVRAQEYAQAIDLLKRESSVPLR